MKNLAEITSIVQDYIDDTSIDPEQHIRDSVNHLSNLFFIPATDLTQTTTIGQNTLAKPSMCLKVRRVFVDDEEVFELEHLDDLKYNKDNDLNKWYIVNNVITFVQDFTASGVATEIHFDEGFLEPETGTDTTVPAELMELVYLGSAWRFYSKLVSKVILNRQEYPDVKPKDIRLIRDDWKNQYFDLIKQIKKYA